MFPVNIRKPFLFLKICCVRRYWFNWQEETTCSIGIGDALVIGEKSKCSEVRGRAPISWGEPAPQFALAPPAQQPTGTRRSRLVCAQGRAAAPSTAAWGTCPPSRQSAQRCGRMPSLRVLLGLGFQKNAPVGMNSGGGDAVPLTSPVTGGAQRTLGSGS